MAMTAERLDLLKAHAQDLRNAILPDWACVVEELIAEVERLTLENLELDLQVAWDRGSPAEIDEAQAAVDAAKASGSPS